LPGAGRQISSWERYASGTAAATPGVKGDTITKTKSILLFAGLGLVGSSMAAFLAGPVTPRQTRIINAGRATLQIPLHLPLEIKRGTVLSGSAILASKDECDITYDQFLGIYWSDRSVSDTDLLPTKAYKKVAEFPGPKLGLDKGRQTRVRDIHLLAEKPCGRIVEENVRVIELYCVDSKSHVVIAGMLDPVITKEKILEITKSLQCP
jgi:hypothetical protein